MISLVDAINDYNTYTPTDVVQEFGGSIGRAAAAIAGVPYTKGVSKNKEYKAARRALERQITGQHKPSKRFQEKINQAGREAKSDRTIGLEFTGEGGGDGVAAINGPAGDEDYEREWSHDFLFSPDEWDEMSDLAAQGDEQGLLDILADKYHVKSLILVEGVINIGEE